MPLGKPFQRKGAQSNAHAGRDFETATQVFFTAQGIALTKDIKLPIGINGQTKDHRFDLGDLDSKIIVECKSHTWTEGSNVPSAKMTTWNQAMYYFYAAPKGFRKIMCVRKDFSSRRGETLAQYYIRMNFHLIPADVEIWELDEQSGAGIRLQ